MSAMALNSCEEIDGGKTPAEPYYLEFVHEADASLVFNADYEGVYEMILNTNVPKKHLKVTSVDNQEWCSADIRKDGGAILLTPGKAVSEDLSASFIIEVTKEDNCSGKCQDYIFYSGDYSASVETGVRFIL